MIKVYDSGNMLRATVCPKISEEELIKTTRKSFLGGKYPSDESDQVTSPNTKRDYRP
jgi:hypothetical protein